VPLNARLLLFPAGKPKAHPRPPGRKSGAAHGPHSHRPIPDQVDEEIQVAAPEKCPDCGGPLTVERVDTQYQEEIVRRTYVRRGPNGNSGGRLN
jgi:transposase